MMDSPIATDEQSLARLSVGGHNDPFVSANSPAGQTHHRFSNFDSQLFALGPGASPAQAKRALEAHLAETDRRMEEAGKLGTALVQQRKELTERLKDVEKVNAEGELSQDLRQKLVEIEKDYNEVARESARAFLPKQRIPSNEAAAGSPFVPEGKGGRRSISPSKFEAQGTGSPTKLGIPNRKVRNQPANRIHDIEFAAEISTSLITQVRNLQALLAEKEEELKEVKLERSKLEYEAEGFQQRVKTLDESEHRYKDENWNLETQLHDFIAKEREAADREKKLQQALNLLQAEKNSAQRELDETKHNLSKLTEDHAAAVKHHDIEIGTAKRNIVMADSERAAMQRKIDDLAGQNQELAKAVSASQRGRILERESIFGMSDEDFETAHDKSTPEHSPPPSPVKGTPRHSMLESETLKTSLGHAQRTIQGLRNNVHREKTEKLELRRMLQEARDEIEKIRGDPMATNKRARKTESREFKKPPRLLGGLRSARSEIFNAEDPAWEDQPDSGSPASFSRSRASSKIEPVAEVSDHFETANENSDAAFETANERATETDDFHTGAEEFSSDDVETETESPSKARTMRNRPPSLPINMTRSGSVDSTASTEDEGYGFDHELRTPNAVPPLQQKFPLRVSRGAFRRSRQASEEPIFQSSPASFISQTGTPKQSLAAELGDFDASDNESNISGTPSRRSTRGRTMSPPPAVPALPKVPMVDSGTMTDPLPDSSPSSPATVLSQNRPMSMDTVVSRFSTSTYGEGDLPDMDERLAKFPSPPTSPPKQDFPLPPDLVMSNVHSHVVEPFAEPDTHAAELAALRAQHAEQLKELNAENAAAQIAALEALKTQHVDDMNQSQAEAQSVHARELEDLRAAHADESRSSAADALATHAAELELLKSSHAEQAKKAAAEAETAHSRELEELKVAHAEQLAHRGQESDAARIAEIEALKANHAELIAAREREAQAAYAADLEALTSAHAGKISELESEKAAAHAAALGSLQSTHAEQISQLESKKNIAHAAELESLKSSHAEAISQLESEKAAIQAAEIEALRAAHAEQVAQNDAAGKADLAAKLAALRSKHAEELATSEKDKDTSHAAEIAALVAAHAGLVENSKKEISDAYAKELDGLKANHAAQIDQAKQRSDVDHAEELEKLKESHLQELEEVKTTITTSHAREIESLKAAYENQMSNLSRDSAASHAAEIAALTATHAKQLEAIKAEKEAVLSREMASLKETHAQEIDSLHKQHAAAHAQELESFQAALDKQIASSKIEGDAAHTQQIEALKAANAEIIEAHKRDSEKAQAQAIESLKSTHERQVEALKSETAIAKSKAIEELVDDHRRELDTLRQENESSRSQLLTDLANTHSQELENLRDSNDSSKAKEIASLVAAHEAALAALQKEYEEAGSRQVKELRDAHSQELEKFRNGHESSKATEIASLIAGHKATLASLNKDHDENAKRLVENLHDAHSRELDSLRSGNESSKAKEIASLVATHQAALAALKKEHEEAWKQQVKELQDAHTQVLEDLRQEYEGAKMEELAAITASHTSDSGRLKDDLTAKHNEALASLHAEHQQHLNTTLDQLRTEHAATMDALGQKHDLDRTQALEALNAKHLSQLEQLKGDSDATLAREIETLKSGHANAVLSLQNDHERSVSEALAALKEHCDRDQVEALAALKDDHDRHHAQALASITHDHEEAGRTREAAHEKAVESLVADHAHQLQQLREQSSAEKEALLAHHASELEALRKSLTLTPPILSFSPTRSIATEPADFPGPRSPKREGFIIPREDHPHTPQSAAIGVFGKRGKDVVPFIAEDDTRQSPSSVPSPETPESQRPFREMSTNTDARRQRKTTVVTTDQSSQTALTSDGLDRLMKGKSLAPITITPFDDTPSRVRPSSRESTGSVIRVKPSVGDSGAISAPEPVPTRRPGSSASTRAALQNAPPLPANHREAIEAARSTSSHGGQGTMGPPLLPASSYRASSSQPQTPSIKRPMSPSSARGTPTPRAGRTPGQADVHSPTRIPMRSRQSSVSSFASEIDTRFNIRGDMGMEAAGFGPGTDPRMIGAITQTMIGEYLWKYTRKAGRGEMSENRHRRYFWVHPYTKTLYWSDRDPITAGRSELKAKSVPIEAVRVVTDDNPMPPGLHRKSLVIISPGRSIKFTCTTGQRHETWFNALSYLLLRTGNEGQADAEEVAGTITQEDVDEFNPQINRRPANGNRTRPPPSLSSYNSRTTRNDSPNVDLSMSIPTLTPTHEREISRSGTLGRISGYWKSSTIGGTFSSLRTRSHTPHDNAIYEASEVHDSAEDLRQMIEQQDREADRLENVRACCDGESRRWIL
ncbi:hypothetical protein F4778DRAFT_244788 [Xylariomycetidae sp. FL2044]|nr:hypothetical protein F4778DRAFT_244788 [Xylariomycetidae sp. FL2044]